MLCNFPRRSFRRSETVTYTAVKRPNSCCKRRKSMAAFYRFLGRNPSSQITYRFSLKRKQRRFWRITTSRIGTVFFSFSVWNTTLSGVYDYILLLLFVNSKKYFYLIWIIQLFEWNFSYCVSNETGKSVKLATVDGTNIYLLLYDA
jgi:hypothetical protein